MPEEDVRRYAGQWVAAKGGRALFGSSDPEEVWDWLDEHAIEDATIIRLRGENDPKTWTYRSARTAAR